MSKLTKDDKIFIAGGSGMVGSAIIRKLSSLGFKNLIYPNSSLLDLKNSDLVFVINSNMDFFVFNFTS